MAAAPALWVPERAEIIFINHSPQAGREIPDLHPLLVISPRAFNERTSIVIGFPMTHAAFHADNPFAIPVKGKQQEVGYVLAMQPKSFDWRVRQGRPHPWGGGHANTLAAALERLDAICGICAS